MEFELLMQQISQIFKSFIANSYQLYHIYKSKNKKYIYYVHTYAYLHSI